MKKKLIFTVCMSVCSISLFVVSLKANVSKESLFMEDVESLTQDEIGGSVIKCRCSRAEIWANKKCIVSNDGNTCAQGQPGQNINCQDWNSNCGGN